MINVATYFDLFAADCQRYGILFDTELLLVLCVGIYDSTLIGRFKKTTDYAVNDFNLLKNIADCFNPLYISPQILAELSNHSDMLPIKRISEYYGSIEGFIRNHYEIHYQKNILLDEKYLPELGFTDISMFRLCLDNKCVLFTADRKLTQICRYHKLSVFNFNEYRDQLLF
jgi:hypothetical protein